MAARSLNDKVSSDEGEGEIDQGDARDDLESSQANDEGISHVSAIPLSALPSRVAVMCYDEDMSHFVGPSPVHASGILPFSP